MKVLSKNNKVILADGQAVKWQSGNDIPLKVLTRNNKLLLADGKALRNLKLPAAYTELPYLVATDASKAWIDLGIPYQDGCKVEFKITNGSQGCNIFGVNYNSHKCLGYSFSTGIVFNVGTGDNTQALPYIGELPTDTIITATMQANPDIPNASIIVGDKQNVSTVQTDWLTWDSTPNNIYLFAINTSDINTVQQGIRVIHYFKYYDADGNLILDLVPVQRNSDGVLGMYNQADGRFLTNISTGTFHKEVPANASSDYVVDDIDIV